MRLTGIYRPTRSCCSPSDSMLPSNTAGTFSADSLKRNSIKHDRWMPAFKDCCRWDLSVGKVFMKHGNFQQVSLGHHSINVPGARRPYPPFSTIPLVSTLGRQTLGARGEIGRRARLRAWWRLNSVLVRIQSSPSKMRRMAKHCGFLQVLLRRIFLHLPAKTTGCQDGHPYDGHFPSVAEPATISYTTGGYRTGYKPQATVISV